MEVVASEISVSRVESRPLWTAVGLAAVAAYGAAPYLLLDLAKLIYSWHLLTVSLAKIFVVVSVVQLGCSAGVALWPWLAEKGAVAVAYATVSALWLTNVTVASVGVPRPDWLVAAIIGVGAAWLLREFWRSALVGSALRTYDPNDVALLWFAIGLAAFVLHDEMVLPPNESIARFLAWWSVAIGVSMSLNIAVAVACARATVGLKHEWTRTQVMSNSAVARRMIKPFTRGSFTLAVGLAGASFLMAPVPWLRTPLGDWRHEAAICFLAVTVCCAPLLGGLLPRQSGRGSKTQPPE